MRDTNHTHKEKLVSVVSGVCVSWGGILLLEFSIPSSPLPPLPPPSFPPLFSLSPPFLLPLSPPFLLPLPPLPLSFPECTWVLARTVHSVCGRDCQSPYGGTYSCQEERCVYMYRREGKMEGWRKKGKEGKKNRRGRSTCVFVGDIPPTDVAIFLLCSCQGSTESANLLHKHNQVI